MDARNVAEKTCEEKTKIFWVQRNSLKKLRAYQADQKSI
jgi:hypothetical protein